MGCGSSSHHSSSVERTSAGATGLESGRINGGLDSTKAGSVGTANVRLASVTEAQNGMKIDVSGPNGPGTGSKIGGAPLSGGSASGAGGGLLHPPSLAQTTGGSTNSLSTALDGQSSTDHSARQTAGNTPINSSAAVNVKSSFVAQNTPPQQVSTFGHPRTSAATVATGFGAGPAATTVSDTPFTPANVSPRPADGMNSAPGGTPGTGNGGGGVFPAVVITPESNHPFGAPPARPTDPPLAHHTSNSSGDFSVATSQNAHTIAGPSVLVTSVDHAPPAPYHPQLYVSTVAGPTNYHPTGFNIPLISTVPSATGPPSAQFQSRPPLHGTAPTALLSVPAMGGGDGSARVVSTPSHAGGSPKSGMSLMSDNGSDPATERVIERPVPELSISRVPASPVSATAPYAPGQT